MAKDDKNLPVSGAADPMSGTNGAPGSGDSATSGDSSNEEWGLSSPWWQGEEEKPDAASQEPQTDTELSVATQSEQGDKEAEEEGPGSMGLLDHLNEMRKRLVWCVVYVAIGFGLCWGFVDFLFDIIMHPLLQVLPQGTHAQYTTLPEAFFTRMEIAFVGGLFLASPAIFYQIWAFVAPGLYDEEKRYIIPIAVLSALFFICGGLFCYYVVFPFAFNFFISYSTPEIVMTPKISDYLSFVLKLTIAFGLIFEMPIFTLFLSRFGIVTADFMRRGRRYAIVVIFILAAILTPPDVVSQILMACPMLLLYEVSIGVAYFFGRKTKKDKQDDETGGEESQDAGN